MDNNEYKCILSIGIRCFTEIYLKELKLKRFSSPFGSLYLNTVNQILYLLKNEIEYDMLIHTENNDIYKEYNKRYGNRTIHKHICCDMKLNENNLHEMFHKAVFAHHNLNNENDRNHYERCFKRLQIIKNNNIRTLFCLFYHTNYYGYKHIPFKEIIKLSEFLSSIYNCHLLVIRFEKISKIDIEYKRVIKNDNITLYHINSNETDFNFHKNILENIMKEMNVQNNNLIDISYFEKLY